MNDSSSNSLGTATISFDLSPTASWPRQSRASTAQALTRCSGEVSAARSKERRSVLPSIATTPWQVSANRCMKPMNQAWKRCGSRSRNSRLTVSWLGIRTARSEILARTSASSGQTTPYRRTSPRRTELCAGQLSESHAEDGASHCRPRILKLLENLLPVLHGASLSKSAPFGRILLTPLLQ